MNALTRPIEDKCRKESLVPNLIDSVNHVVVVTGAGFSAHSGLPVYRNGGANWLDVVCANCHRIRSKARGNASYGRDRV